MQPRGHATLQPRSSEALGSRTPSKPHKIEAAGARDLSRSPATYVRLAIPSHATITMAINDPNATSSESPGQLHRQAPAAPQYQQSQQSRHRCEATAKVTTHYLYQVRPTHQAHPGCHPAHQDQPGSQAKACLELDSGHPSAHHSEPDSDQPSAQHSEPESVHRPSSLRYARGCLRL